MLLFGHSPTEIFVEVSVGEHVRRLSVNARAPSF